MPMSGRLDSGRDLGGHRLRLLCGGCLHHDTHELLGAGGPEEHSSGGAEFGLTVGHCLLDRSCFGHNVFVGNPHVEELAATHS